MTSISCRRPRLSASTSLIAVAFFVSSCQSDNNSSLPESGTGAGASLGGGGVASSGGASARGGASGQGGGVLTGGAIGLGGATATGGAIGLGGATATGGAIGLGGATATGGAIGLGGATATGGAIGLGGATAPGGATASGGAGGAGGGGAPDPALETIVVQGSTGVGVSKTSLDNGELFLLRASGTVDFGTTTIDAEFGGFAAGKDGTDSVGGVDVGVDFGLKTVRAGVPAVDGRMKWFGAYRGDHIYYVIVNGVGNPLSLKLLNPASTAGSGSITVSLYRLSPTLQTVGTLVDTVPVPVIRASVKSSVTTSAVTTYLLQSDGQAPCGSGGTGNGDADYMDYAADGTGKVDIGDANTDYGTGVDEPFVGNANSNTPRKRWWGQWRKDHIYYMLFAGTGNPIQFDYYDSNYGDNSTTVKLTVTVRELH